MVDAEAEDGNTVRKTRHTLNKYPLLVEVLEQTE